MTDDPAKAIDVARGGRDRVAVVLEAVDRLDGVFAGQEDLDLEPALVAGLGELVVRQTLLAVRAREPVVKVFKSVHGQLPSSLHPALVARAVPRA